MDQHSDTPQPVPRWAIHRRLYDWILGFAKTPAAPLVLLAVAFIEAFMPFVPPDALLAPMCLGARRRALLFAVIAVIGSVLGAFMGYLIGSGLAGTGEWIVGAENVQRLVAEFAERGDVYVFVAALTPIPFHVLTIAAGVAKLNFGVFAVACIVGRSLRYGLVATIFWWIGPQAKPIIDRWFNLITIVVCVLLVLAYAAIVWLR
ncbi:MAG: VTT domain-containing protein [Phycisphaerales bacterium]|jgi:membrane protein YqaA with SNARE-associated domain|nr:VTT domain-containing protein [Phycisphaerales bacterium]